jgi:hypothetical protein
VRFCTRYSWLHSCDKHVNVLKLPLDCVVSLVLNNTKSVFCFVTCTLVNNVLLTKLSVKTGKHLVWTDQRRRNWLKNIFSLTVAVNEFVCLTL